MPKPVYSRYGSQGGWVITDVRYATMMIPTA